MAGAGSISAGHPGDLDPTFGTGGKTILRIGNLEDSFDDVVVQPDGKIVAVGNDGSHRVMVARYNTDGSLDANFGVAGISFLNPGGISHAYTVALQTDNKIVVAGYTTVSGQDDFVVLRYNPDGMADPSFNGIGYVVTHLSDGADYAFDVAIQTDGKIVVVGQENDLGQNGGEIALIRYNTDGSLDTAFDGDGIVRTLIPNTVDRGLALKLQTDGKIVATAYSADPMAPTRDLVLLRYLSNGQLDPSFDGDGIAVLDVGMNLALVRDLVIQPDGKIVVGVSVGSNNTFFYTMCVLRFLSTGALDLGFGGGGVSVIAASDSASLQGVVLQPDGKIVAAGHYHVPGAPTVLDIFAARLRSDGTLDPTFGNGGIVTTPVGNDSDYGWGLALQADGKIVVSGDTNMGNLFDYDAVLVRYLAANNRTHFDFDGDGKSDISVLRSQSGQSSVWYMLNAAGSISATPWGAEGDVIAPGDFDGDGRTDVAVFREGTWFILQSSDGVARAVPFGIAQDKPVVGDYDGDGKDDIAVYRQGAWFILQSATNSLRAESFGLATDKPITGDFDGDGKSDLTVFRDGFWYSLRSSLGFTAQQFGLSSDRPVARDYDGDGRADFAVYRDGVWYLQQSTAGFVAKSFGLGTDQPVPADYDGDGKADLAVFRAGSWYVSQSSNGVVSSAQFGVMTDRPVPAADLP